MGKQNALTNTAPVCKPTAQAWVLPSLFHFIPLFDQAWLQQLLSILVLGINAANGL
jgi:hypothetical protein